MTTKLTTYRFTVPAGTDAADFLAQDPASASGTLAEAVELADTYNVTVSLTDEAGFAKGRVEAGGKCFLR
jgi:hypothetical protein